MLGSLDTTRFDNVPGYLLPNVTGHLVYDSSKPLPPPPTLNDFNIIDDFNLVPLDHQALLPNPDQTITLELNFTVIENQNRYGTSFCLLTVLLMSIFRATWNNVTYISPKVPSLATALTVGKDATDPRVYGVNANPFVLRYNKIIELVINNIDGGAHPIRKCLVHRSPSNLLLTMPRHAWPRNAARCSRSWCLCSGPQAQGRPCSPRIQRR